MSGINPFDPERDPALGALLREALTGADQAGFLARVRASVALTRQERTFDVLAALVAPEYRGGRRDHAAGCRGLVVPGGEGGAAGTATVAELLVSDSVPAQEILLAGLLEAR